MNIRDYQSVTDRRNALEKELKVSLPNIGHHSLSEFVVSTRNCENMIGASQVPIGIAGPLKITRIKHESEITNQHEYYIPLATTEGALVASVNRGSKAITQSGGAVVDSYRVGATRGPVFKVRDLTENDQLNNFIDSHFDQMQKIAAQTSTHLALTKYFSRGLGKYRFVRFVFDTKDAMGMNMATIATEALVRFIEEKTSAKCISFAGNYDVDKKPTWLNSIEGRGTKVWAEATIPSPVLRNTLKTSAQKIYDVWLAKCMIGSAMSGSMGFNAHYANILAAIFLATGQDVGHVGECSVGITTCEVIKSSKLSAGSLKLGDLYISIYLPDLMIGTVGGGTGLATQKEALQILGVDGGDDGKNAQEFAEIVGGAVLAGELSLLASLSEGTLAKAHERLARGKSNPTNPTNKQIRQI